MLKNISSIIFAVITLVAFLAIFPTVRKLLSLMETLGRKSVKFGEALTSKVDGNPELSLEWPGKCRDLTADKSERHLDEKVHTFAKALDKLNYKRTSGNWYHRYWYKLSSSSFDSKPYPISGGNWWNIGSWFNRIRCSKKRNGQLSLFRIDMNGAVNA